jgi:hypothetical protein
MALPDRHHRSRRRATAAARDSPSWRTCVPPHVYATRNSKVEGKLLGEAEIAGVRSRESNAMRRDRVDPLCLRIYNDEAYMRPRHLSLGARARLSPARLRGRTAGRGAASIAVLISAVAARTGAARHVPATQWRGASNLRQRALAAHL